MRVKNAYPKTHISEKTRIPPPSIICMVLRNVGKKRIKFQNINYHNTHIFSKFQNKTHIFQNFTRIKKNLWAPGALSREKKSKYLIIIVPISTSTILFCYSPQHPNTRHYYGMGTPLPSAKISC